jgi:hypothetical protein
MMRCERAREKMKKDKRLEKPSGSATCKLTYLSASACGNISCSGISGTSAIYFLNPWDTEAMNDKLKMER